jgi:hypothetical protein
MSDFDTWLSQLGLTDAEAVAFISAEHARAEAAEARVADYENRITWDTTCAQCATYLDASIKDHVRAEKAEAALERVREAARQAADELEGGFVGSIYRLRPIADKLRAAAALPEL